MRLYIFFRQYDEVELKSVACLLTKLLNTFIEQSAVIQALNFAVSEALTRVFPCINITFGEARLKCIDQLFTIQRFFVLTEKQCISEIRILEEQFAKGY